MNLHSAKNEGRSSAFASSILLPLYGKVGSASLRSFFRSLILRLEHGAIYSTTIREVYRSFHHVDVGLYTIGPCEGNPGNLAAGTVVGRYSSIYFTVRVLSSAEVSMDEKFPYVPTLGRNSHPTSAPRPKGVVIGNDVFIGHNALILPNVQLIGDGAFIGAGSVVQNDVPPYAVVTGNPARVVRYRFSPPKVQELLASQWWNKSIDELSSDMDSFRGPLEDKAMAHA